MGAADHVLGVVTDREHQHDQDEEVAQPISSVPMQLSANKREGSDDSDRSRVPPDLRAPAGQDLGLAMQGVAGRMCVPDVGVLGDDPQGDPFALAADEDRDRPNRRRVEALEAGPDDRHVTAKDAQPLRGR